MNKKTNILLISPESWSHIFVSKHHYALELSRRGHRVYFLNPPDPDHYRKLHISSCGIENLYLVNYPGQLKGMRFLPAYLRRRLNRHFLQQLEALADERMDIVWNFENSRFYDLGFAGDRLKIYHQVDLTENFHLQEAASTADICFCTTDFICKKITAFHKKVFKIHHGVSQDAFGGHVPTNVLHEHPVVTLVGNLDIPYLDHALLQTIVQDNPRVQFKFIGGYNEQGTMFQVFSQYQHVQFIGRVESSVIKNYLAESDVLLVCYKANEYCEQLASPHKMMEYFASGKVIVATYTDEYKDKRELLAMSNKNEEYPALFAHVVANLPKYNNAAQQEARIAFARENSYSRQLDRIIGYCYQIKPGFFS